MCMCVVCRLTPNATPDLVDLALSLRGEWRLKHKNNPLHKGIQTTIAHAIRSLWSAVFESDRSQVGQRLLPTSIPDLSCTDPTLVRYFRLILQVEMATTASMLPYSNPKDYACRRANSYIAERYREFAFSLSIHTTRREARCC
ncbi:unnamed protein product [Ectocarpus sp. 12 AP-2014]